MKANTLQKFCRGCKSILPLSAFPPHVDLHTVCRECQSGRTTQEAAAVNLPAKTAPGRKLAFPRRHGSDNRD